MTCSEVMLSHVFTCKEGEPASAATRLVRDERVGFVPVVDGEGKARGILTDRDIGLRIAAAGKPATTPVEHLMSPGVMTCRPEDDLREVEARMGRDKKSRALVVDAQGRPAGVISLSDIALVDAPDRVGKLLREVTQREVALVSRPAG
ncbi:MAG: CBS domain-containing protein [Deltaproteobacteria bacterium]|nr:CBS domain-containing protein [Deltaproteobacteria bacterium]